MDFADRAPLSLDRDRVTCILLINTHLIKKCCNIHNTMLNNPQFMQQISPENRAMLTNTYNHYIRRLQCNLATLNYIYEKYHSPQPLQQSSKAIFPIILSAPQDMPELNQLYSKLQELYPEGVQYFKMKFEESRKQQAFQQQLQLQQQQHQQHQQQQQSMHAPQQQSQQVPPPPQQVLQQQQQSQQQSPQTIPQMMPQQLAPQSQQQQVPPPQTQSQTQSQAPPPPPQQQQQQQHQPQQQQQAPPQSIPPTQLQPPPQSFDDILLTDGFNPSNDSMPNSSGPNEFNSNYNNNGMNSFQMSTLSPQQILQQANSSEPTSSLVQDFLF